MMLMAVVIINVIKNMWKVVLQCLTETELVNFTQFDVVYCIKSSQDVYLFPDLLKKIKK